MHGWILPRSDENTMKRVSLTSSTCKTSLSAESVVSTRELPTYPPNPRGAAPGWAAAKLHAFKDHLLYTLIGTLLRKKLLWLSQHHVINWYIQSQRQSLTIEWQWTSNQLQCSTIKIGCNQTCCLRAAIYCDQDHLFPGPSSPDGLHLLVTHTKATPGTSWARETDQHTPSHLD